MNDKNDLESIFNDIRSYLDEMDLIREKLLSTQRSCIRTCSQIIKNVHRNDFESIDSDLKKAKQEFDKMLSLSEGTPGDMPKDYISIAAQELGEAIIFYNLIVHQKYPSYGEVGISSVQYAYALSDVVGELRRYILKSIREEDLDRAFELFDHMNEIYSQLFTLDYPNGLIPGLRRKVDAARGIIAKTEGDITISSSLIKFNKTIQEKKQ